MSGVAGCPIFRGSLAVNPETGDTFAWTVDDFNQDQGMWQDVCGMTGSSASCASATMAFGTQLDTTALEVADGDGPASIANGDYNLTLAAVPGGLGAGQDTLLFAGGNDLFKCSLANSCVWRNTTNATTCMSAQVGEYQHALGWDAGNPLLVYVGNDSGLWRSSDQVGETGPVCAAGDATHFQNLNSGLESAGGLTEVEALAQSGATASTMLVGLGVNGISGVAGAARPAGTWNQVLGGEGGPVAIDQTSHLNSWYANNAAGVSIEHCVSGSACTAAGFAPAVGEAQVDYDGLEMPEAADFVLDALDDTQLVIGTCRVWRGPAAGTGWTAANAISPVLDGAGSGSCNGNALIRSMAVQALPLSGPGSSATEVMYVGMAGVADGGGIVPGHVFAATVTPGSGNAPTWTDLTFSPVVNSSAAFNSGGYDVSGLYVDPHDPSGNTVYAAVEGFPSGTYDTQTLYQSTDGGAHWTSLQSNLPQAPANAVAVDPQDAGTVYVATDVGVYFTRSVGRCGTTTCWALYGAGLPEAPVTQLVATPPGATSQVLTAGTYGRGVWQAPLATAGSTLTTYTASPASLSFPAQAEGTTSAALTVVLKATGTASLVVTGVAFDGLAAADFGESNTCSGAVAKGATCTVLVTFAPTASGSLAATLVISANVAGGQIAVPLSGTGLTGGSVTLLPTGLSFGTVQVGTSAPTQTVNVQNVGGSPVTFSSIAVSAPFVKSTSTCASTLAAATACAVVVGYAPVQAVTSTGSLTVTDSAGTQSAVLTGAGITGPTDTLSTNGLTFPGTVVGQTSAAETVSITNSGGLPLTSIGTSVSGNFTAVNNCGGTLAAGDSCGVAVTFSPVATGPAAGSLVISDALRSQTVTLSGGGLRPPALAASTSAINFGSLEINLPLSGGVNRTISIQNTGGAPLAQPTFTLTGSGLGNFQVGTSTCPTVLAANAVCNLTLVFSPVSSGTTSATLTIATSTPGVAAVAVSLSGTGLLPPMLSVSPPELDFGAVIVGNQSATFTVAVKNTGQVAMLGPTFAVSGNGDFAAVTPTDGTACTGTLNAGATCNGWVQFSPSALGAETGVLTVTGANAIPATSTVALTGTGSPPIVLEASPAQLSFPATSVGSVSAIQTVAISDVGRKQASGLTLILTGPYQLATGATTCKSTLGGTSSCTVGIGFAPGVAGDEPGTLTVSVSNLGVTPLVVALDGTGLPVGALQVSPTQLTFGSVAVSTASPAQTLTLSNTGQAAVTGLGVTAGGNFSLTANQCPATLPAPTCSNGTCVPTTCTTGVVFTPQATGQSTGLISITTTSTGVMPLAVSATGSGVAPGGLTTVPGVVSFGAVTVGQASPAQTVVVSNPTSNTVTGLQFAVSGDYGLGLNGCGTQIGAGGSCSYPVTFSPTQPGTRIGAVTITSSMTGFVPVVTGLTGTGSPAAQLAVTPGQLSFGPVAIGSNSAAQQLTVSNAGTGALSGLAVQAATPFSVGTGSCPANLSAGGSCTVPVTFSPTVSGPVSGAVLLSSSSLGVAAVQVGVTGTGLGPAALNLSPAVVNFSAISVGQTSAGQTVTISNPGGFGLAGLSLAVTGDFTLGTSSCGATLAAGSSCAVVVSFAPTAAGGRTGFLTASSSSSGVAAASATLNGTGLSAAILSVSPPQLTFASTLLGQTSAAQTVTVANIGQSAIPDLQLTVTAGFALAAGQTSCTQTLAAGTSCTAAVDFAPTIRGPVSGALTASSLHGATDGISAASVALSGTGAQAASIGAAPASLIAFGITGVRLPGQSILLTVTNEGTASTLSGLTLGINAPGSAAGFGLSANTCSATLAAGASCTAQVTFTPTAAGQLSGTLTVGSSNGGVPTQIALSGIGFDFTMVASITSASVVAGQTAYYTLVVTPVSGAVAASPLTGAYSFQCGSLPSNALCVFNPPQLAALPAGVSGNVVVGVGTASATALSRRESKWISSYKVRGGASLLAVCWLVGAPIAWWRRKAGPGRSGSAPWGLLLLFCFAGLLVSGVTSCAGAGGSVTQLKSTGGTPTGSYSVQVTASANGVTHSVTVKLAVN